MDLAPARLRARERLDYALQRAVRPSRARNGTQTESVPAREGCGDLSKHSAGSSEGINCQAPTVPAAL